jgi:hypothetical protein
MEINSADTRSPGDEITMSDGSPVDRRKTYYERNRERILAKLKARKAAMTPIQREMYRARARIADRQFREQYPELARARAAERTRRYRERNPMKRRLSPEEIEQRKHERWLAKKLAVETDDTRADATAEGFSLSAWLDEQGDIIIATEYRGNRALLRDELIRRGFECFDQIRAAWRPKS